MLSLVRRILLEVKKLLTPPQLLRTLPITPCPSSPILSRSLERRTLTRLRQTLPRPTRLRLHLAFPRRQLRQEGLQCRQSLERQPRQWPEVPAPTKRAL